MGVQQGRSFVILCI